MHSTQKNMGLHMRSPTSFSSYYIMLVNTNNNYYNLKCERITKS